MNKKTERQGAMLCSLDHSRGVEERGESVNEASRMEGFGRYGGYLGCGRGWVRKGRKGLGGIYWEKTATLCDQPISANVNIGEKKFFLFFFF